MSSLLILIIAAGFMSVTSRRVNFYRKDYTYLDEMEAFYKVHWVSSGQDWTSAFLACDKEGAELFYPENQDEWTVVKELMKNSPYSPNIEVSEIYVGIHDKFAAGEFVTINGHPTPIPILNSDSQDNEDIQRRKFAEEEFDSMNEPQVNEGIQERCVTLDIETGLLRADECFTLPDVTRPFICKKVQDVHCPTIDTGYRYYAETKKCYKLNNKPMTWSEAMKTCRMEGGVLLVIESDFEAGIMHNKIIPYDGHYVYYSIGFKKLFNDQYYTVKGRKLIDTGFNSWNDQGSAKECGTVWDSPNIGQIYLSTASCQAHLPFVCEINVSE